MGIDHKLSSPMVPFSRPPASQWLEGTLSRARSRIKEAALTLSGAGPVGSIPAAIRGMHNGAAATFDQARADFAAAWRVFLSNREEADFQA
jgi:hypothetical protein